MTPNKQSNHMKIMEKFTKKINNKKIITILIKIPLTISTFSIDKLYKNVI